MRLRSFSVQLVLPHLFIAYVLFSYVGLHPFSSENLVFELDETGGGNLIRQAVYILFFLLASYVFFISSKVRKVIFDKSYIMVLIVVLWCFISVMWSDVKAISFRRVLLLALNTFTLIVIVNSMSYTKVLDLLSKSFVFLLIVSFFGLLLFDGALHTAPELFDSGLEGNWKGVFPHKNDAAPAFVFAIFIFAYKYLTSKSKIWLFLIFASLIFIFFSKSKTSLALLLPSVLFGWLLSVYISHARLKGLLLVLFILFGMVFLLISPLVWDGFINILADPEAFTGRATIWDILVQAIYDNTFFGIGFGSTWHVGNSSILPLYSFGYVDWVFTITQGHNGYLDLTLSIGLIGFLLFFITYYVMPFLLQFSSPAADRKFVFLFFSFSFFTLLHGMLETNFLVIDKGYWVVFFTVYILNINKRNMVDGQ